jgi:hypothetical protein
MSHTYSACMAQAVEARLVRKLDTPVADSVRECVPFPPPRVEVGPHGLLQETSGMHWA